MPNWCFNRVAVNGSVEDIRAFKDLVKSDARQFDFERIMPMPHDLAAAVSVVLNNSSDVSLCEPNEELVARLGVADSCDWRALN